MPWLAFRHVNQHQHVPLSTAISSPNLLFSNILHVRRHDIMTARHVWLVAVFVLPAVLVSGGRVRPRQPASTSAIGRASVRRGCTRVRTCTCCASHSIPSSRSSVPLPLLVGPLVPDALPLSARRHQRSRLVNAPTATRLCLPGRTHVPSASPLLPCLFPNCIQLPMPIAGALDL